MSKNVFNQKELADDFFHFRNELRKESDRGAVILAVAFIDAILLTTIQNHLLPAKESGDELFKSKGPLDSFSAKIDLAYRVGLLSENVRSSLHLMRKLRNDFSHLHEYQSFSQDSVKNRVQNLVKLNEESAIEVLKIIPKESEVHSFLSISRNNKSQEVIMGSDFRETFQYIAAVIAGYMNQFSAVVPPIEIPTDKPENH